MVDRETYLRTQQVADALGVSISSVKRWVDKGAMEATRTMGKHRLVALSSALKFARDEKFPTDHLLALASRPVVDRIDEELIAGLVESLRLGRGVEAARLISSVFFVQRDAVALADRLIRPVLERLGQLWLVGACDVYQEHQATQIIISTLNGLIRDGSIDQPPGRPIALGAAPEGDVYLVPLLLGELLLQEGGWDVKNLGCQMPLRSMAAAIRHYRPKLIFLTSSSISDRDQFVQEYSYFYEAATQVGAAIILGGRALDADLRSKLVYASFGDRMAHLAEFARQFVTPPGRASNDLESTESKIIPNGTSKG